MAPSPGLLATKLNAPPLRPSLVARPRLTARLTAGLPGALTLISAPAGSGKSILVTEWLASFTTTSFAWLSLDEDDNDPIRFLAGLGASLGRLGAPGDGSVLALLTARGLPAHAPKTLLNALLNDFQTRPMPSPALLVLDDYHTLTAPAVHALVAHLLERRPTALHLIITSRTEPPLPLARLRAGGQLTEIRAPDLHFTTDEAADFLNRAMGLNLSAAQVAALEQRTEGWIAGLQLAALALRGQAGIRSPDPRADFVAGFTGSHRYILDYLVEEVLARQPVEVQSFLRQTALLDTLSGPLCEAVTGQPGGAERLIELERANLFLVPLDGERRWYRYHHLFAEALRDQLVRTEAASLPVLHRRASRWFEAQALLHEAIHHALAAGDHARAADLIDPAADQLIRRGELETIRHWLEALPADLVRARPSLCLWQAWCLIPHGRLDEAGDCAATAETGLLRQRQTILAAPATNETTAPMAQLDMLLGQVALVRCSVAQYRGDVEAAATLAQQALATLPPENLALRSLAKLDLAHLDVRRNALSAARASLEEALEEIQGAHHPYIHLQLLSKLAEVSVMQLRLHLAADLCQRVLALTDQQKVEVLSGEARLYLGELAREWNRLDEAEVHLGRAVAVSERSGDEVTARRAYTVWSRVKQAQGDWAAAAAHVARGTQNTAWQARHWLSQGNLEAARALFAQRPAGGWGAHEDLARARVRLAQGQAPRALAVLKRWRAPVEAAGRHDLAVEVALLQALAYQAQAQWPQALRALQRVLALAEPAGCVRLFLDEGEPMAALLTRYAATQPQRPYVQRLLAAFPGPVAEAAKPDAVSNGHHAAPLEPLRVREAEILRLLADGQTNPEIAARLSLSVDTVRWYIKQLYRKLDVHNRTQAALRARELGLA